MPYMAEGHLNCTLKDIERTLICLDKLPLEVQYSMLLIFISYTKINWVEYCYQASLICFQFQ